MIQEMTMAKVGSTPIVDPEEPKGEPVVDFMADAPAERPYVEAITDAQREMMSTAGLPVE